ncbi:hypothetical protein BC940DRAFT_310823, partial [Gongronella butleri]
MSQCPFAHLIYGACLIKRMRNQRHWIQVLLLYFLFLWIDLARRSHTFFFGRFASPPSSPALRCTPSATFSNTWKQKKDKKKQMKNIFHPNQGQLTILRSAPSEQCIATKGGLTFFFIMWSVICTEVGSSESQNKSASKKKGTKRAGCFFQQVLIFPNAAG